MTITLKNSLRPGVNNMTSARGDITTISKCVVCFVTVSFSRMIVISGGLEDIPVHVVPRLRVSLRSIKCLLETCSLSYTCGATIVEKYREVEDISCAIAVQITLLSCTSR